MLQESQEVEVWCCSFQNPVDLTNKNHTAPFLRIPHLRLRQQKPAPAPCVGWRASGRTAAWVALSATLMIVLWRHVEDVGAEGVDEHGGGVTSTAICWGCRDGVSQDMFT